MKKVMVLIVVVVLTLVVASSVVVLPPFFGGAQYWLTQLLRSEEYLLITNGWTLTQLVFPHFGIVQLLVFYGFAFVGFVVVLRCLYLYSTKAITLVPSYREHKKMYLLCTSIVLVSLCLGVPIGFFELGLRNNKGEADILIGQNLTPPATWKQQVAADDKGMCFLRKDYEWNDTLRHVNRQGFFSKIDYTQAIADSIRKKGKKILFVIGDSFVEGFTSGTWDNTFSEILKRELVNEYVVFSMGVSGTDPLDYRLRLEHYTAMIKPDFVIVCFCGNNDVMHFDRSATPNVPILWTINNTFMYSNLYNKVILTSPDSAYRYLYQNSAPVRTSSKTMQWLCKHVYSVALVYNKMFPWLPTLESDAATCTATYKHLQAMHACCRQNVVPLRIAFIPDKHKLLSSEAKYRETYSAIFGSLIDEVDFPTNINDADFGEGNDIHFNDRGNRKFANFLIQIVKQGKNRGTI